MKNLPAWARGLIIFGIILIIVLPLGLFAFNYFAIPIRLSTILRKPITPVVSARYSVKSDVPGYTIQLADTKYLDYLTANIGIFDNQAIVDPRVYRGFANMKLRYTVTHIQLDLVPSVDWPFVNLSGTDSFVSKGDYLVDHDTLVVRIYLDISALTKGLTKQFSLEDTYLRTLGETLSFSHGISPDPQTNGEAWTKIADDIQNYLYTGIFAWPIRIEAK